MSLIKSRKDKPLKENRPPGNPNWGGSRLECKVIQQRADEWCRENGYPIQRSRYWKRRKWTRKKL